MNWKEIKLNLEKEFTLNGEILYERKFEDALKFHEPGLAPVKDGTGWFHITAEGGDLYSKKYIRAFGYYNHRAAVEDQGGCFHIDEQGKELYTERYNWCGNFQEEVCTVRKKDGHYQYIDLKGQKMFGTGFLFAGDFKDGFGCIKTTEGWTHINKDGKYLHNQYFKGLGTFHKGFATAMDAKGWFHIDLNGRELYRERYDLIEPFYNGTALAFKNGIAHLVNESGNNSLLIG